MTDEELQQMSDGLTVDTHELASPSRTDEQGGPYDGNPVKDKALAILSAFAVTGMVAMTAAIGWGDNTQSDVLAVTSHVEESIPQPPETANPYEALALGAKAAVVYDVHRDAVLYGHNEKKRLSLASLTKLMTGLVVMESLDQNKRIAISRHAIETEGDSGLYENETWSIKDLVSFTMLTSSNDGADALAAAAGSLWESTPAVAPEYEKIDTFVTHMNARARELGMNNTRYENATGLDEPGNRAGAVGSAEDVSKLLTHIWENTPEAILHTDELEWNFVSEDGFVHTAENTNEYVRNINGLLGSKTGYTDLAGGNLAIIYDAGMDQPVVIVVLGSTIDGRFLDVQALVDATQEYVVSGWYDYEQVAGATKRY